MASSSQLPDSLASTIEKGGFYCVSLGPGAPELITLASYQILQEVDLIFCPTTARRSRSHEILKALGIDLNKVLLFQVTMSRDRTIVEREYAQITKEIEKKLHATYSVALVAEGDAGFYSSARYITEQLNLDGVPVHFAPGVPAFIAAGACASLHIVKQEESLTVMTSGVTMERVRTLLEGHSTVVIMKLSQHQDEVRRMLQELEGATFHYFENVSLAEEYYTTDRATILERGIPYFAMMVIQPRERH